MSGNYPDNVDYNDPTAPWNQTGEVDEAREEYLAEVNLALSLIGELRDAFKTMGFSSEWKRYFQTCCVFLNTWELSLARYRAEVEEGE